MKKVSLKARYIILIITLTCVTLIVVTSYVGGDNIVNQTVGYIITPIQKGFNNTGNWFSNIYEWVTNLDDLEEDNELLKAKVEELEVENSKLKLEHTELERLRELFQLSLTYEEYPMTGARIIAKAPGNWYNTFTIDKGKSHGIEQGMVVIAYSGLVGHIVDVSEHYAVVQSIIDDTSSVHGQVVRTSDTLFVEGDKLLAEEGLCQVTFINSEAEIVKGDNIVTSQLGDIYPPGIKIGMITDVEENPNLLTKTAYLKPVVDFSNLNEVLIITQPYKEDFENEKEELEGLE